MVSLYGEKKYKEALEKIQLFKDFSKLNYKDVSSLKKKIKTDFLYEKVKSLPGSEAEKNLGLYSQLLTLNPNNKLFRQKVAHYQAKAQKIKGQRDRKIAKLDSDLYLLSVPYKNITFHCNIGSFPTKGRKVS